MAENDNTPENLDGPEALRKAYDKMKQQAEAAAAELATLKAEKRTSTVAELLKAKGAPAKAAKFYTGEADEASVMAWLKENEDLFPVKDAGDTGTGPGADANSDAASRLAAATAGGDDESTGVGQAQRTLTDPAEIQRLLANTPRTKEGYATLVRAGLMPANPNAL
jgi:membrane protein involved in colicin uptake